MQKRQKVTIQSFKHVGATKSLAGSFRWVLGLPGIAWSNVAAHVSADAADGSVGDRNIADAEVC
jgi:hypothetical protein